MLTSSALYKRSILRPGKLAFEVDLYDGLGNLLENEVPIFKGSIGAALQQRVTRSGTFSLGARWWPGVSATAALTPYQTIVNIRAGARYGDGSRELFDIITGRVGNVTRNADGSVTARVDDLAADVIGLPFEQPRNSENVTVTRQIERLIQEVLPAATFGPYDVTDATTPKLTWDEDRGKALDDLAATLGARWYCLGDGSFVIREYPYDDATPVQTIADAADGGLMLQGAPTISRDDAANSVTVVVERFDGGTPFRVTMRDMDPTSPTFYGGPFGRVGRLVKVQTPLTVGQATQLARAQLNASTALSSTWSVQMRPDYTLEPGDTVRLTSRGFSQVQVIDQITYPLGEGGTMDLSTRAYVRAAAT